jgi:hypothetical protein
MLVLHWNSFDKTSFSHPQLIKQLSATPKIPAQGAADVAQEVLDPQAALRANKEVFFFRLVCFHASHPLFQGSVLIHRNRNAR